MFNWLLVTIIIQDGEDKGRQTCEGLEKVEKGDIGEAKKEEMKKKEDLRISHNLFNATLRPLVAGLEYHGDVKTLKTTKLDLYQEPPTPTVMWVWPT